MNNAYLIAGMAVMAGMTYLIRMLPMVIFRKKITNVYIRSFLYYVPYTVLAAMTFPAIFSSTGSAAASAAGCVAALLLAFFKRGLLTVAVGASAVAFLVQLLGL